jgi:hypothetical protein
MLEEFHPDGCAISLSVLQMMESHYVWLDDYSSDSPGVTLNFRNAFAYGTEHSPCASFKV